MNFDSIAFLFNKRLTFGPVNGSNLKCKFCVADSVSFWKNRALRKKSKLQRKYKCKKREKTNEISNREKQIVQNLVSAGWE